MNEVHRSVLEELVNGQDAKGCMHDLTISAATLLESNQWCAGADRYVTFSGDGAMHIWSAAQGIAQKQHVPFVLKGPATMVLAACSMTMHSVAMLSSNDEVIRAYAFEPRPKLLLEYHTQGRRAVALTCFAARLGPDHSWLSWVVWGDDSGCLHFVPEKMLLSYTSRSVGAVVAQLKAEVLAATHRDTVFTVTLFTGWVTCIRFIADLGLHGAVIAAANDGNVVMYDVVLRSVMRRFEKHRLAVKSLVWMPPYRSVASSGLDREILIWDPATGVKTARLRAHKAPVIDLCFQDTADYLFSVNCVNCVCFSVNCVCCQHAPLNCCQHAPLNCCQHAPLNAPQHNTTCTTQCTALEHTEYTRDCQVA